jgi:hypothetical protein
MIQLHFCFYIESMLSNQIVRSLFRFALTKFPEEVAETVLPTAPQLTRPQVIDTQTRE